VGKRQAWWIIIFAWGPVAKTPAIGRINRFHVGQGPRIAGFAMLTLPNILTLSRIFAVPLLVALLWWPGWPTGYALGFAMYCLMGVTDYFDGYLARAQGQSRSWGVPRSDRRQDHGRRRDPCADRAGVLTGPYVGDMHVIAGLVILLREIAVSGLREFLGGIQVSVPVSKLAKWKTTFQMISLGALILGGAMPWWTVRVAGIVANVPHTVGLATLWGAAGLTVITGWDYLRVGLKHMD
jgi:CDP-diacylglycerol--glycerol-3-phosphate 3-phosphatidyltransferase/cardiolipin synthase